MFGLIAYQIRLRRLQRIRRRLEREFDQAAKEAMKSGGWEKAQSMWFEEETELGILDAQIGSHVTARLRELCQRMLLPLPRFDAPDPEDWSAGSETMWDRSRVTHQVFLSPKGIAEVRSRIRQERKERWEFTLALGALLIGLVGTLTGLAAVLAR
jgi:hypothetical protein